MASTIQQLLSVAAIAMSTLVIQGASQDPKTPAIAQPQNSNPQSAPATTIKTKTQVVLLDVIATDKRGNPITDLKREDFTILEKGRSQQVASFAMVDTAKHGPMPGGGVAAAAKLPPGVFTNKESAAEKEGQLVVLLLDALNTPWKDQAYARNQMLSYLKKNQSSQRMAIYGLTTKLIRLQDFTNDPALLKSVLEKHKGQSSPLLEDPNEPGVDTSQMTADMAAGVASFQEEQAAYMMDMRVRITLDALKAIGRELSGYPGRKKLIWVTASIPVQLEPGENASFTSQRSYGDDITKTTSLLRDAQVSVYTVDAQGLVGPPLANAEFTGRTSNGRMMTGPQLAATSQARLNAVTSAHMAAQMLADGTGGKAYYNRNDLDTAVMKSVADGAIYYALSYSPEDKNWDGQYRRIEVKVNRPGVELRYRKGYFARDPQAIQDESAGVVQRDMDNAMMSLLTATGVTFYGSAFPLKAPAKTGEAPDPNAMKMAETRFLVEPRDINFQPTEDKKQHCSVQFAVGVFKDEKLVNAASKRMECNLSPETYAKLLHDGILFQVPVEAKEEKSRIRLVVRDNLSGKIGSLDIPYPPQAKK